MHGVYVTFVLKDGNSTYGSSVLKTFSLAINICSALCVWSKCYMCKCRNVEEVYLFAMYMRKYETK